MSELKVNSIVGLVKPLPDNLLPITASAWVSYASVGAISINDSFNVSSVVDNGTGISTINFATALLNANYSVSTFLRADIAAPNSCYALTAKSNGVKTTAAIEVVARFANSATSGYIDSPETGVTILGGQS